MIAIDISRNFFVNYNAYDPELFVRIQICNFNQNRICGPDKILYYEYELHNDFSSENIDFSLFNFSEEMLKKSSVKNRKLNELHKIALESQNPLS